jgi:hypothetical protein
MLPRFASGAVEAAPAAAGGVCTSFVFMQDHNLQLACRQHHDFSP